MRLHLVLIGPPGCGKGTQAVRIAERYRIPHISTGDALRAAVKSGSALGRQVEATMAAGGLVSDDLITQLVAERLSRPDAAEGFILDGFPRTIAQAQALDGMLDGGLLVVAVMVAADEEIARRLGRRRICAACGLTQSVSGDDDEHMDPCPYCGGRLVRRPDDEPETVLRRLRTFASFAAPVIEYYRPRPGFGTIDAVQAPDAVSIALRKLIDSVRGSGG
jgi:adenylate kinase